MTVHEHALRVLSAGIDGQADPDDLELASAHVDRCCDCRLVVAQLDLVAEAVAVLIPSDRPDWLDHLDADLVCEDDHAGPPPSPPPARRGLLRRRSGAVAEATLQPMFVTPHLTEGSWPNGTGGAPVAMCATVGVGDPVVHAESHGDAAVAVLLPADPDPDAPAASGQLDPPRQRQRLISRRRLSQIVAALLGAVGAALLTVIIVGAAVWLRGSPAPAELPPVATPGSNEVRASAVKAARAWIKAVADDDQERAWSLLSERGRSAMGGRSGLERRLPDLATTQGLWSSARGVRERVVLLTKEGAEVRSVVVLSGRFNGLGADGDAVLALPVVTVAGSSRVEPFEPSIDLGAAPPGRDFVASIRPQVSWVGIVVDDGGPVRPRLDFDAGQQAQLATVSADLAPGRHTFVTVAIDAEGRIAARADVFERRR